MAGNESGRLCSIDPKEPGPVFVPSVCAVSAVSDLSLEPRSMNV